MSALEADAETDVVRADAAHVAEAAPPTAAKPSVADLTNAELVDRLHRDFDHTFPTDLVREAQRRRERIVPELIALLRMVAEDARNHRRPQGDGYLFALFLLAEFEAKEAWPVVREAMSLPDGWSDRLFGDTLTEELVRMIPVFVESPAELDELIRDEQADENVRWSAMGSLLYFVRDGRTTREEAVEQLRRHLVEGIARLEESIVSFLVCELAAYRPVEALHEIEEAFRLGLVDESLVDREHFDEDLAKGARVLEVEFNRLYPVGIADTVEEMSDWECYLPEEPSRPVWSRGQWNDEPEEDFDDDDLDSDEFTRGGNDSQTVRNLLPKVGRNEPCPCGSGKKYKRCCGQK